MKTSWGWRRMVFTALALCTAQIACRLGTSTQPGEIITETQSVDRGAASVATVVIDFGAGMLTISGGAEGLMDASFQYNVLEWQPAVDYSIQGTLGNLQVNQSGADSFPVANPHNQWDLRLASGIPLDLTIHMGAGVSKLELAELDLRSLIVDLGAASTTVGLTGTWEHDVRAFIIGGAGEVNVDLPAAIGARVNAVTAIGSVTTSGLHRDGEAYVNDAFGLAAHTLTLDLDVGVGSVQLRVP